MSGSKCQVAVITGTAGRGIGFTTAKAFAKRGYTVLTADIEEESGAACAAEVPGAHFIPYDASRFESVTRVTERASELGDIQAVVDFAARIVQVPSGSMHTVSSEAISASIDGALKSAVHLYRAFLPYLVGSEDRPKFLGLISSCTAHTGDGEELYSAAKGGVEALAKSAVSTLGLQHCRCVPFVLGTVKTPNWKAAQDLDRMARCVPLGKRIVTADEVAEVIVTVADPRMSAINGQPVYIDRGQSLMPAHAV